MGLVQKSFSDIITFSRSSNATRVGPTGVLEYAPHNLLTYSQDFSNAAWDKGSGFTLIANAIAAPDGTVTADLFTRGSTGLFAYLTQVITGNANQSITFSCWVRTVSGSSTISLNISDYLSTTLQSAFLSIDTTWRRLSFTVNAGQLSNTTYIGVGFLMSAGQSAYFWGAQLAVGPYALDYVPTTSAAVYGPRFDYDGSGVTIVEPVSRNLVTYSEQFDNAAWTKTDATVTANTTTAPDGTVTADLMYPTTTGTYRATLQSNSGVSGQVYTASFYIKSAGFQWVALMTSAGGNIGVYFDVINGAKGTEASGTGTITSVGNGWFRCTITTTASSSTIYSGVTVVDANNSITATTSGTSGVYLWGAQLEVGSTATGYMVSGATNGFRAVPVVSGSATARGLLVEEQRTNLALYSEDFSNAAWSTFQASALANVAASPNGTITADQISSTAGPYGVSFQSLIVTIGVTYTFSVYVKAGTSTSAIIGITDTTDYFVVANLSTGTINTPTAGSSATIQPAGNGWYRITVTRTSGSIYNNGFVGPYVSSGSILAWGAQFEAGSFATSYIPTLASTVTRSADVASVNTLSPWFNATEGTLFAEALSLAITGNAGIIWFSDGGNNNFIGMGRNVTGFGASNADAYVMAGGSPQAFPTQGSISLNTVFKEAFGYKLNDFGLSLNGQTPVVDTSGTLPVVNQVTIGNYYFPATYFNGHLRRIAVYPRRLTNAELQALTA